MGLVFDRQSDEYLFNLAASEISRRLRLPMSEFHEREGVGPEIIIAEYSVTYSYGNSLSPNKNHNDEKLGVKVWAPLSHIDEQGRLLIAELYQKKPLRIWKHYKLPIDCEGTLNNLLDILLPIQSNNSSLSKSGGDTEPSGLGSEHDATASLKEDAIQRNVSNAGVKQNKIQCRHRKRIPFASKEDVKAILIVLGVILGLIIYFYLVIALLAISIFVGKGSRRGYGPARKLRWGRTPSGSGGYGRRGGRNQWVG